MFWQSGRAHIAGTSFKCLISILICQTILGRASSTDRTDAVWNYRRAVCSWRGSDIQSDISICLFCNQAVAILWFLRVFEWGWTRMNAGNPMKEMLLDEF